MKRPDVIEYEISELKKNNLKQVKIAINMNLFAIVIGAMI